MTIRLAGILFVSVCAASAEQPIGGGLPEYLMPASGDAPLRGNYDAATGISSATFPASVTAYQVFGYYKQVLLANGWAVFYPAHQARSRGTVMSAWRCGETVAVLFSEITRQAQFTVTYVPPQGGTGRPEAEAAGLPIELENVPQSELDPPRRNLRRTFVQKRR
jgi:hypothetical protein